MADIEPELPTPSNPLFRHRPFLFYFLARTFSQFAYQMAAVAVGWQIYALTSSAFYLGMVGLAQFLPTLLLIFVAGHAADRYNRMRLVQVCQLIEASTAIFLTLGTYGSWITVHQIFAAVTMFGVATAFEAPSRSALLNAVVPAGKLQKSIAVSMGSFQLASICAPAIGGLLYAVKPGAPYAVMAVFWLIALCLNMFVKTERPVRDKEPASFASLFAGIGFVRNNHAILGTISLDLFAVLLGGATALLPIYARDILHTGPWGLGVLRSAPAAGAFIMTAALAKHTLKRKVGIRMFQSVVIFGLATVVFAASTWIWLSLAALAVMGAADTVSMVIRGSLVQLQTPDHMRGRVGAVNFLFINASNQLGEFESGMTAALFGTVPAAMVGGIGTVLVALLWMRLFPELKNVERLE